MSERDALRFSASQKAPLYQQIKDQIRERIDSRAWPPGKQIPSEHQIVRELGVSRMTVNRALRELTQEGVLERIAGVGRFVAEPPHHASLIELRNIAEEIAAEGSVHTSRVVWQGREQADEALAEKLGEAAGSEVFHVTLVHMRDAVPIQLEDRWVSPVAVPEFLEIDFTATTPSEYLLRTVDYEEMEHVVQAILPDAATAELLAIATTEPCLRLSRRTWNRGCVVTHAVLTYPSSRYDLGARYQVRPSAGGSRVSAVRDVSHRPDNPEKD